MLRFGINWFYMLNILDYSILNISFNFYFNESKFLFRKNTNFLLIKYSHKYNRVEVNYFKKHEKKLENPIVRRYGITPTNYPDSMKIWNYSNNEYYLILLG